MSSDKHNSRSNKRKAFPENWNIDFTPLQQFVDRMDNLFSRSFKSFQGQILNDFPVETIEKEDTIYVKAEVPGYRREDIQIEMVGNRIKITLDTEETVTLKTDTENASKKTIHRKERIITLPFNIPNNSTSATLENGILIISIPKESISYHFVDIDD